MKNKGAFLAQMSALIVLLVTGLGAMLNPGGHAQHPTRDLPPATAEETLLHDIDQRVQLDVIRELRAGR